MSKVYALEVRGEELLTLSPKGGGGFFQKPRAPKLATIGPLSSASCTYPNPLKGRPLFLKLAKSSRCPGTPCLPSPSASATSPTT